MAEEKQSFFDRLGPTLTSGLIIAFLSATSLGAVAIRDLVLTTNVDITYLKSRYDDLESRIRTQESRPPRLTPGLEELKGKCEDLGEAVTLCKEKAAVITGEIQHLHQEQDKICQRIIGCNNGNTSTNNSSSNRSRN